MRDLDATVRDYRAALTLGASRPLSELYTAAGAELLFDPNAIEATVAFAEAQLEALEEGDAAMR